MKSSPLPWAPWLTLGSFSNSFPTILTSSHCSSEKPLISQIIQCPGGFLPQSFSNCWCLCLKISFSVIQGNLWVFRFNVMSSKRLLLIHCLRCLPFPHPLTLCPIKPFFFSSQDLSLSYTSAAIRCKLLNAGTCLSFTAVNCAHSNLAK